MLSAMSSTLLPTNTVWLCDFNSVILPNRDVSHVRTSVEHASVLAARDEEIRALNLFNVVDSFAVTHSGRLQDVPLEGWTWGFPSTTQTNPATQTPPHSKRNKPAPRANPPPPDTTDTGNNGADCDRRRRIDRILIPAELQPHIDGCYPSFLANSDHKMVTLLLAPNFTTQTVKRKRCPTTFLSDEDVTDKIQSKLVEISLAGYSGCLDKGGGGTRTLELQGHKQSKLRIQFGCAVYQSLLLPPHGCHAVAPYLVVEVPYNVHGSKCLWLAIHGSLW